MTTLTFAFASLLVMAPVQKPSLVVAPLRALGDIGAEAEMVTEEVRGQAVRAGRYTVVTPQDIDAIDKELEAQLAAGCDETSCMADLGGALGAQYLIAGSLGKLGKRFVLTLKLVDLEAVRAVRTSTQRATSVTALVGMLEETVFELLGVALAEQGSPTAKGMGTLVVGLQPGSPEGVVYVWVDGRRIGQASHEKPVSIRTPAGIAVVALAVRDFTEAPGGGRTRRSSKVVDLVPPSAWPDALIGEGRGLIGRGMQNKAYKVQIPVNETLRFGARLNKPGPTLKQLNQEINRSSRRMGPLMIILGLLGTGALLEYGDRLDANGRLGLGAAVAAAALVGGGLLYRGYWRPLP
jgi:hypothetical protein